MEIQIRSPHENKNDRLILALCLGAALCFADDPQVDTSKLNESKSKFTAGTEKIKPTYISLVQFTDKGIQNAKQTTQRVAAWAAEVQSMGVTIKQMYWTLGQYDQVCIFEARMMRRPPVCCWRRTCWATSVRRRCALSPPPRWRRSWPRCPDGAMTNDPR